jgi:hypothetical protein
MIFLRVFYINSIYLIIKATCSYGTYIIMTRCSVKPCRTEIQATGSYDLPQDGYDGLYHAVVSI